MVPHRRVEDQAVPLCQFTSSSAERSAPVEETREVMPASYAYEIRRMHRDMYAEGAKVRKSTQIIRVTAARAAGFDRGSIT